MLEKDPGSLIRKRDLQEELSVIELQISNMDQGGKVRELQSREADAAVAVTVQAQGSSSSSATTISKYHWNNLVIHNSESYVVTQSEPRLCKWYN
jgi:hypothetical protein